MSRLILPMIKRPQLPYENNLSVLLPFKTLLLFLSRDDNRMRNMSKYAFN